MVAPGQSPEQGRAGDAPQDIGMGKRGAHDRPAQDSGPDVAHDGFDFGEFRHRGGTGSATA